MNAQSYIVEYFLASGYFRLQRPVGDRPAGAKWREKRGTITSGEAFSCELDAVDCAKTAFQGLVRKALFAARLVLFRSNRVSC